MLASLALSLLTPEAAACGGFFCNNIDPVEQAGEIIVFEVDPEAGATGKTTMHVQVEYDGPPIEFAWVVPVRGTPDLFVSNDALFNSLDMLTRPQFYMWTTAEGECMIWDFMMDADGGVPAPPPQAENDGGGVQVLAQQTVGPYDTVVLSARDEDVLIQWLQDNSYNVPSALAGTLAPYLADGHNFVALRLAGSNDTSDLVPLGMRYDGTTPAIPIQLTSVAATPDMQLVTYVLGPDRAVPENYLHVELNESAVDWFSWGGNYMDVLSRAADEAGGHAFTTEYAGSTENFRNMFYQDSWATLDLAGSSGPTQFIERVTQSGIPASASLLELLTEHVPVPAGYDARSVYNCPGCYPELDDVVVGFDATTAAAAVQTSVIEPLAAIDAMFDRTERITRLGSTMSPSEMTVDPMFTFNADLPQEVSNVHEAQLVYLCEEATDDEDTYTTAPKNLVLPNGSIIKIPSNAVLQERGLTDAEYLAGLIEPAASRIERTGSLGLPDVIFDGTLEINENIDRMNDETDDLVRRGCNTGLGGAGIWLVGLLPLALRRRR